MHFLFAYFRHLLTLFGLSTNSSSQTTHSEFSKFITLLPGHHSWAMMLQYWVLHISLWPWPQIFMTAWMFIFYFLLWFNPYPISGLSRLSLHVSLTALNSFLPNVLKRHWLYVWCVTYCLQDLLCLVSGCF